MKWFRRNLDQQVRYFYLPIIILGLCTFTLVTDLPPVRKAAVILLVVAVGLIHYDLKDGGIISRAMYSRGGNYILRNYLTVIAAFVLAAAILAAAGAFNTPLMMIFLVPIFLAGMRGGHRMSLLFTAILMVSLYALNQFGDSIGWKTGEDANLYLFIFFTLSLASGFMSDRLRRAAVDLSALYETGRALNSTLNVAEIYKLVMNIIALDLTPDISGLFMIDGEGRLRIQAHQGLDEELARNLTIEDKKSVLCKAADTQSPISISEASGERALSFAPDIKSIMAVPLHAGGKMLGVIMVGRRVSHTYGYENLRFLESLSGQAAISIQNAWMYRQTKEWASRDGMTGIYNYRYFSDRLDHEWTRAQRYEKSLSLIMIDLDFFKKVNDEHGHLCGDEVLREVAVLLENYTRETDIVARYGGEEFAIILPETFLKDAYVVGEKLRHEVEQAIFSGGMKKEIKITLSIGIANYPSSATSKSDIIYQADQALYRAKSVRNQVVRHGTGEAEAPSAADKITK